MAMVGAALEPPVITSAHVLIKFKAEEWPTKPRPSRGPGKPSYPPGKTIGELAPPTSNNREAYAYCPLATPRPANEVEARVQAERDANIVRLEDFKVKREIKIKINCRLGPLAYTHHCLLNL